MKVIDQNTAAAALEAALVPGPSLIDGRTEIERLNFLCRLASVINFYDQTNRLNGNWQPFLLKDPVLLLASISKTDYQKEYHLFIQTCANLQKLVIDQSDPVKLAADPDINEQVVARFNQLFDQLTRIFLHIERWTYFMQMGLEKYDLKTYVIDQVKSTYNEYLWAILALRDFMASTQVLTAEPTRNQILPVSQYVLDSFTDELWTKGGGTMPFLQVLGLYTIDDVNKEPPADEDIPSSGPIPYGVTITTEDYFTGLKNTGVQLFRFYHTIIQHAGPEYEKEKEKKSSYPDTLLLRTFSELMKVHQQELNAVANKHLHFYYSDILKQSEQPAVADSVFISLVLGKNISVFELPAGTLFNAGNDANKNPILFATNDNVSLNAGVIATVYTLAPITNLGGDTTLVNLPQLYLQNITAPGTITTNENGQNLSWDTFGGATNLDSTAATTKQMGFAFASPMLYLPEGTRQITINLVFDQSPAATVFAGAQFFLSTAKAWLSVTPNPVPSINPATNTLSIQITLDATQSPITAFATNPDGLSSSWPMFKVIFNSFSGLAIPPVVTSIGIDVIVTGVTTLALYNDYGLLSTKNPFQLFGPIVNVNSNFLIGSSEIFSKPLNWLSVEVDWDTLPSPTAKPPMDSFSTYYYSYNNILFSGSAQGSTTLTSQSPYSPPILSPAESTQAATTSTAATVSATEPARTVSGFRKFLQKAWKVISWPVRILLAPFRWLAKLIFKKKQPATLSGAAQTVPGTAASPEAPPSWTPPAPPNPGQSVPFTNICFSVGFSVLNYNSWDTFFMYNYGGNTDYATWLNNPVNGTFIPPGTGAIPFQLFDTSNGGNLGTKSIFGYFSSQYDAPADLDPTIQNSTLAYDGTNESGFIKMTLTNPANGFGATVYPTVVTDIVTQNALKISGLHLFSSVKPSDLIPAANAPFAPKVQAISAMYSASQTYNLTLSTDSYPVQYFYYTPFANYKAYDNSPALEENYSADVSMMGDPGTISGVQLVPSFTCSGTNNAVWPCSGSMFIGLSGLIFPAAISLYFELSTTFAAPTTGAQVDYYYLGENGWTTLPVLKDGTNGFTCSGIITVNIPADITNVNAAMPGSSYWISIGATIDPSLNTTLNLSSFANVVLLAPNGAELTRSGTTYLTDTTAPVISSGAITKPQTAIPQLGSVAQPFASFGGRAAETKMQMYERVSGRLKTKDRAVSGNDMFTLIREEFPDIYFSGATFYPETNSTSVYVVEGFGSFTDANAYRPYVAECEMEAITKFLEQRISLFSNITVLNYEFQNVNVTATVTVKSGYIPAAMEDTIADALNIYFSPWIANAGQEQVAIGQPITETQVASFIRGIDGVATVSQVELSVSGQPLPGTLFVSSLTHAITATPVPET